MMLFKVNDKDNFRILTYTWLLLLTSKVIYVKTEADIQKGILKSQVNLNQQRDVITLTWNAIPYKTPLRAHAYCVT